MRREAAASRSRVCPCVARQLRDLLQRVERAVAELVEKASCLIAREALRFSSALAGSTRSSNQTGIMPIACQPVAAGQIARFELALTNDADTPRHVALYASNFIGDLGYEVPSWRITCSPRGVAMGAHSSMTFEVAVEVPEQTPAGSYSALLQAFGVQAFKAVLVLDVL
jgi:hypothetical protein